MHKYIYIFGLQPHISNCTRLHHMEYFFIIFLLLFKLPVFVSTNQCPVSICGNNAFQIRYPFKLGDEQQSQNCNYTDVKCISTSNITALNLPFSGDFYVRYVDYDSSTVALYDPDNCLPRRLMNLSLEGSPFVAKSYQKFTFYNCPVGTSLKAIECLSNSTNSVVAVAVFSGGEVLQSCTEICTKKVVVSYDFGGNTNDLVLKWDVPVCKDCSKKRGWKLKLLTRFFAFILMIPAIALLLILLFFCIACCMHAIDNRSRQQENALANQWIMARIRTFSTSFNATGLDASTIKSCSELVVVDINENGSIVKPMLSENQGCSICLEEYSANEKVRLMNLCQHCFHADCIEEWLQKNSTCPICRICVIDVNYSI